MENKVLEELNKPTYEQLLAQVYQLVEKCKTLYQQLQEQNFYNVYKRLDYCFKIIENEDRFTDYGVFVEECKKEIMDLMYSKDTEKAQ